MGGIDQLCLAVGRIVVSLSIISLTEKGYSKAKAWVRSVDWKKRFTRKPSIRRWCVWPIVK